MVPKEEEAARPGWTWTTGPAGKAPEGDWHRRRQNWAGSTAPRIPIEDNQPLTEAPLFSSSSSFFATEISLPVPGRSRRPCLEAQGRRTRTARHPPTVTPCRQTGAAAAVGPGRCRQSVFRQRRRVCKPRPRRQRARQPPPFPSARLVPCPRSPSPNHAPPSRPPRRGRSPLGRLPPHPPRGAATARRGRGRCCDAGDWPAAAAAAEPVRGRSCASPSPPPMSGRPRARGHGVCRWRRR